MIKNCLTGFLVFINPHVIIIQKRIDKDNRINEPTQISYSIAKLSIHT